MTHLMVFLSCHCGHVMLLCRLHDVCNAANENKRLIASHSVKTEYLILDTFICVRDVLYYEI